MKNNFITKLIISLALGTIITSLTFFIAKGNCTDITIDMPNIVSKYEASHCNDLTGINDKIYGYPLPFMKIGPRCSGVVCPMDMYSKEKIAQIIWTNLIIDITIWSAISFIAINLIDYLRKSKNDK